MLDPIRLATPEEIESIRAEADLTPRSSVYAMENSKTGKSDLAVIRQCMEIDPLVRAEGSSLSRAAAFVWALEAILRSAGSSEYYAQIRDTDTDWKQTLVKWGMQPTSTAPEIRFKKLL